MRLRTSLKIAIICLSAFFSLPSLAEAQRVAIKQITDTSLGFSSSPSISGDGTKVAFVSVANITGSNEDGSHEIFLYDIPEGILTQITNTTGTAVGYVGRFITSSPINRSPSISANGTKVIFVSSADIMGSNKDRNWEIFLYDIPEGILTQITNTPVGSNRSPSISADGNEIVFESNANITGSNKDRNDEIFLYDIPGGKFTHNSRDTLLIS